MSKAALALVGLIAGVGVLAAIKSADAAEADPPDPNDNIDTGDDVITEEPDSPPEPQGPGEVPDLPAAGGNSGAGSGAPIQTNPTSPDFVPNIDILRPETILAGPLANVNLDGITSLHYLGMGKPIPAPGQPDFMEWVATSTLTPSGMPVHIWVSFDNPNEWITAFLKEDPPGSIPPFHWIPLRVSNTQNKDWMTINILGRNP